MDLTRDDKEILLAVDFKKAPKEVQDAVSAHAEKLKAVEKSRKKLAEANQELAIKERELEGTAKAVRKCLDAWTPEV